MFEAVLTNGALSLAAAAAWGAADFSGGFATKKSSAFGVVVVAHGTGLLFLAGLALLSGDPFPAQAAWLWGAMAGLAGGLGLASLYRALAIGQMGINAPVAAVLTAVLPVLFGIRTEGVPHPLQLLGFVLALISIWLIAMPSGANGRPRGLGLAIVAGTGFGCFLICTRVAGETSAFWPLVAARGTSLILMLSLLRATGVRWRPERRLLLYMVIAGLLDAGGNALFVAAARHGRLDVAAVLSSFYPASTVILARLVLNERFSRLQGTGVFAAFLSIPLIVFR